MAQRRGTIDYSLQLPDIAAPQESRAGDLMRSAGAIAGRANATDSEATAGAISFLGTNAIGAVKGKLEADVEGEIRDSLNKLEGVGPEAKAAAANVERLRGPEFARGIADQLTTLQEQSGMEEPQLVKDFMVDIQRYAQAQEQGTLSRGDVITRIAASVKKYATMAPGWAADFRKIGAEMTGISNVDVYGVHKLLTEKTSKEKMAEKVAAAQLDLDKDIARTMGVPLDRITPEMRQLHFYGQQLKLATEQAENKTKMKDLSKKEADESYGQLIDLQVNSAVVGLSEQFAKLTALNANPSKALEAKEFGLQLSGQIVVMGQQLEQEVRAMTRPAPGKTPLTIAQAEARIKSIRDTVKELQEGVKTVEGRNMLAEMVKVRQGQLDNLLAGYQLANPHIAGLNKLGVLPSGLAQAWITLPKEEFARRFPTLAPAFENIMKNPNAHANLMIAAATGQPVDLSAVNTIDPNLAKGGAADMVHTVTQWATDPNPTEEKKSAFANTFGAFYSNPKNFNPSLPKNIDSAHATLSNPAVQGFFGKLTDAQRQNALAPLVAGLEQTVAGMTANVRSTLERLNDPRFSAFARDGRTYSVEQDPLTKRLVLKEGGQAASAPQFVDSPTGAAMAGPGYAAQATGAPLRVTPNEGRGLLSNEPIKQARDWVERTNKLVETYTLAVRAMAPDVNANINDVRDRAAKAVTSGEFVPLSAAVATMFGGAPRNTEQPVALDADRVLRSIVAAERSGTAKGDGKSSAGALGRYQFMPETAKQYGLKIDPAAGVDERTDVEKAGQAALKYTTDLFRVFEGDIQKVAAAYNAGQGSVQKAVKKAKDLGVPEDWRSFLPKPEETVPYIRRFIQTYEGK